ncbi:hypothetical protein R4Z10_08295 [Niallia sp. XMNu-256]|uniref:hypothetical protein n=1 Tax=Niallia sp. XMNu-256 TaxID=3082444 RepID=UPI0030D6057F
MNYSTFTSNQLKQIAAFQTEKEFQEQIEKWLHMVKQEFTNSELVGLNQLIRSSMYPGVTYTTITHLLQGIQSSIDCRGISSRTFKRMLIKAKAAGLLIVYPKVSVDGLIPRNLYIFQPFLTKKSRRYAT